jgi:hypothetical protein
MMPRSKVDGLLRRVTGPGTMMLSKISWPPSVAPRTDEGYKHVIEEVSAEKDYTFSLQRLHEGAWWKGFLVTSIDTPQALLRVVLRRSGGAVAFDTAEDKCKWTQKPGVWTPLPWPIPAAMATEMGLYLDVSLHSESDTSHLSMKASFHEVGKARDRFLFTDDDGVPVQYWDSSRYTWGNPLAGGPPVWRSLYTVVPTMIRLLRGWDDNKVFCIHEWNEIVPMA